jgi:hypothetical protein
MSQPSSLVSDWFGPQFAQLHPLLQSLHRHGGVLRGVIDIELGHGLAGKIGRRLARSVGIPVDRSQRGFEVEIRHTDDALLWNRRFDNGAEMRSRFEPVGTWPQGHWIERTGAVQWHLAVDIVDGGWQWRPLRAALYGVRVPLFLLPKARAGKHIDADRYVFSVEFALPWLGKVLSYSGALHADPAV